MDLAQIQQIIANGEDSTHQFKEDIRNVDSLAAEMVAFSNSEGGCIFIGVSNQGLIKGLSGVDVDRINQLISNAASQHVRSPITVKTENIGVGSNRIVITLTIFEGIDKPYFDHQGVIWLKSGADKRRVNSKEELQRLFAEADIIHADEVPTRAKVKTLNIKLLSEFLQKFYHEKFPKTHSKRLQFLENMSLATGNQLNLAGLLLFSQKPQMYKPQFIVKAVCFAGNEVASQYLDSEDFEGPLPSIFQGALAFVMRNLRKIQGKKGVNSIGEPEIPQTVFEELLVNALIHRDYFISAPIRLFVFGNRIEIISPGHLPNHLTIEKIRVGTSIQRNPILTSFVSKGLLPYRGLGTGVRRALEVWPKIKFIDDREGCLFTTVIERINLLNEPLNGPVNELLNEPVNALQKKILEIVSENPSVSYEIVIAKLGKSRSTVMRHIQQLKALKLLRRRGTDKKGYWEILENLGSKKVHLKEPLNGPVNELLNEPVNALQKKILEIVSENPSVSYESVIAKLGKSRSTVMRHIQQLKALRLMRRRGTDKKGYWEILDNLRSQKVH